jgi:ribonuclease BN (tRNA processing enzyme)
LLTHTHWDHIQGLPFFLPIFRRGSQIHIYGADDEQTGRGIDRAMSVQLQHSYFPISETELKADVVYHGVKSGQGFAIGSATITPLALNHPVVNFGYRIDDSDGSSLFFTGDYEPLSCNLAPDHANYAQSFQQVDQQRQRILALLRDVDTLIVDASYTDEEYQQKIDWGHGTYEGGVRLAQEVRAKQLFFTHHEPTRSDVELESIFQLMLRVGDGKYSMQLAQEGQEHEAYSIRN